MKFKNIFTEYDKNIEKSIDLDPLGIGIIWRYFGQQIFHNKITSSTFNVRNFNINLFNHVVIKHLSQNNYFISDLMMTNQKETIEKLLIILENMLIYSWYKNQDVWNNKVGLSGTSKAISLYNNEKNISFDIQNSYENLELLKSQKTTGVNGTHKGAFVGMGFFMKDYDKESYLEKENIDNDLENMLMPKFQELFDVVVDFFNSDDRVPSKDVQNLYIKIFAQHSEIANYTKPFWLKYLGFDTKEAKAIYSNIDKIEGEDYYRRVIQQANSDFPSKEFDDILSLEPKLSYLEDIFNYLLACDGEDIDEIEKIDCIDFSKISFELELESFAENQNNEAKNRLEKLTNIQNITSLIEYHKEVMKLRDQNAWMEIDENKKIKVNNFHSELENSDEDVLCESSKLLNWKRNYYLNSVDSIKKGLES
jgi:hypothetical protein